MRDGRPLRFLGGALGGWTLFRIAALWPVGETAVLRTLDDIVAPAVAAVPIATKAPSPRRTVPILGAPPTITGGPPSFAARLVLPRHGSPVAQSAARTAPARPAEPPGALGPPLRPTAIARGPRHLAGSAWLLARGGPSGTLSGGRLGASQAGVRLTDALDHAGRLAIAARIATPLAGPGREAAIGIDWKPTRLPFHLIAEQRVVLDGGKGGPTIGIIGGYGPATVMPGVRIESYAQAGAIARGGIEGFVDAAARGTHPLITRGPVRIDAGVGAWGSAQRGAARLDLGPTIGAVVPVGQRGLRLSVDWRQRVAGNAHPGSGPAFTIGTDF